MFLVFILFEKWFCRYTVEDYRKLENQTPFHLLFWKLNHEHSLITRLNKKKTKIVSPRHSKNSSRGPMMVRLPKYMGHKTSITFYKHYIYNYFMIVLFILSNILSCGGDFDFF